MYDVLTTRYTFSCPVRGETHVRLSSFRALERLPGSAHPAVFRISFACGCGEEHPRPVCPSSFLVLAPGVASGTIGVAVRCPACERVSLNLVSHEHVDLP